MGSRATWHSVSKAMTGSAPLIAKLLDGPMAEAAGALIASELGVSATPESVHAAIEHDFDATLPKIRELESREQSRLIGLYTELLWIEMQDRISARDTSIRAGDRKQLFVLSVCILFVVFGLEGLAMFVPTAPGMSEASIGRILGGLDGLAFIVGSYWFGSSLREQPHGQSEVKDK